MSSTNAPSLEVEIAPKEPDLPDPVKRKAKPGESWKGLETHVLPKNNLIVVRVLLLSAPENINNIYRYSSA